jgi:hypothetical protein
MLCHLTSVLVPPLVLVLMRHERDQGEQSQEGRSGQEWYGQWPAPTTGVAFRRPDARGLGGRCLPSAGRRANQSRIWTGSASRSVQSRAWVANLPKGSRMSTHQMGTGTPPVWYQRASPVTDLRRRSRSPYQRASVTDVQTVAGLARTWSRVGTRGPTMRGRPFWCGRRGGAGATRRASRRKRVMTVATDRDRPRPTATDRDRPRPTAPRRAGRGQRSPGRPRRPACGLGASDPPDESADAPSA